MEGFWLIPKAVANTWTESGKNNFMESLLLVVITLQGFVTLWFESEVWKMTRHRFDERAKWREEKRRQALKKDSV